MRSTKKEIIGGVIVLLLTIILYVGVRIVLSHASDTKGNAGLTPEELKAIADFENDRMRDSARQQAHWDSLHDAWAREKAERQQARMQREQAYADSQAVWAARRSQWAREKAERAEAASQRKARHDSLAATYPKKLARGAVVDANAADAELLMRIPGVGEHYAAKILAYREALGGFVSPQQLNEIEGLPYDIATWFCVNLSTASGGSSVKKININRADFKTLVHHPYLSYEQTKSIANLRRNAPLRSWNDLRGSGLFDEHDIQRLSPYITF